MKLTQFKKDCEAVGLDWKLVKTHIENDGGHFFNMVDHYDCPAHVLSEGIYWGGSPEGYIYWKRYHKKLEVLHRIAKPGEVCRYEIRRHKKDWEVGCDAITPKQRLKLFKLLADDLGYELTD